MWEKLKKKYILRELPCREVNYKAELVITNESIDICENYIKIRTERPKINLKTKHEDVKDLCFLSGTNMLKFNSIAI